MMTAHNNLGKYNQKGKMGTSESLQRMVRTTNTHPTYSSYSVLTSCYEKWMVHQKKKKKKIKKKKIKKLF